MTEGQMDELREWARVGNRSLQRELIWRLFSAEAVGAPKYASARVTETVQADAQPRDIPSRTITADQGWLMRRAGKRK
jgi:hypothetical protein